MFKFKIKKEKFDYKEEIMIANPEKKKLEKGTVLNVQDQDDDCTVTWDGPFQPEDYCKVYRCWTYMNNWGELLRIKF